MVYDMSVCSNFCASAGTCPNSRISCRNLTTHQTRTLINLHTHTNTIISSGWGNLHQTSGGWGNLHQTSGGWGNLHQTSGGWGNIHQTSGGWGNLHQTSGGWDNSGHLPDDCHVLEYNSPKSHFKHSPLPPGGRGRYQGRNPTLTRTILLAPSDCTAHTHTPYHAPTPRTTPILTFAPLS